MKPTHLMLGGILCVVSICYVNPLAVGLPSSYTLQGFLLDLHERPLLTVGILALKSYLLYSLGILTIPASLALGKRDVTSTVDSYGQYLEMARNLDPEGCLPRFVCEIMANPKEDEDHTIQQIKSVFSKSQPIYPFGNPSSARFSFDYATIYGKMTKDPKSCAAVYPTCQSDSETLRRLVITAFNSNL